jgi:hypothetical protein
MAFTYQDVELLRLTLILTLIERAGYISREFLSV